MNNSLNILRAIDIKKRYSLDKGVGPVCLRLSPHNIYSIIGSNGSGKTTLIKCLCKIEEVDSGTIEYITSQVNLKMQLAYSAVFQEAEPFPHLNVLDNIALPLILRFNLTKREAAERSEIEIEKFGLKNHLKHFPHQLSGGLRQRVVQARTFAMKPKFLFLDEPTSALDPEWTEYFGEILKNYSDEGNSVLLISHQINFIRKISKYVFFLDKGIFLEEGDPNIVFSNPVCDRLSQFLSNS